MQNIMYRPPVAATSRSTGAFEQGQQKGSLLMNGLLLLVSIPAALLTFMILIAMVPVHYLGIWLK